MRPARPSFFDDDRRREIVERLGRLGPDTPRRWGRMTAPRMIAHLTDQMTHTLGDVPVAPVRGPLRWPGMRYLAIYWIPWPRGRLHGPPEAYVTEPAKWLVDLAALVELVERFARRDPEEEWPDHALFGAMTGEDWGVFCHKHFDHHLRQFGV
jgi:hypothetical protein